ncbi:MAG: hypothetical protein JHC95_13615 [Solirubrobacteraceae bacterium]|nr:hypothetical protein [Solirubrobacteraceae bacterium]
MATALLLFAAFYGALKIYDFAESLWAVVVGDPRVKAALGIEGHQLVRKRAERWNSVPGRDTWTPVFELSEKATRSSGGRIAALVLVGVLFRAPILALWQTVVIFAWGDANPSLAVVTACLAVLAITSTLLFYLVTLSLGAHAEARAGHRFDRGLRTLAVLESRDAVLPEGQASANGGPSDQATEQADEDGEARASVIGQQSALPVPSLLTLPTVIGALLASFASLYFAISLYDPAAFVIRSYAQPVAGIPITPRLALYFAATGRDLSPTALAPQMVVIGQTFLALTGVALFVSAANAALRRVDSDNEAGARWSARSGEPTRGNAGSVSDPSAEGPQQAGATKRDQA